MSVQRKINLLTKVATVARDVVSECQEEAGLEIYDETIDSLIPAWRGLREALAELDTFLKGEVPSLPGDSR
jgi:hypothetical protein